MEKICNLINGELVAPASGKYIDNVNPSTNRVINLIPDSDYRDVAQAIKAAKQAYKTWGKLHYTERVVYLEKIASAMADDAVFQEMAVAESNDMGKPLGLMLSIDMPAAVEHFRMYSRLIQSETTPYYQMIDAVAMEHRNPIGIVGLITPWNFPLMLFCSKISAALACGNCCVCKPSELSPTTSYLLSKILSKILPPGVVNVVHGYGPKAGQPIVEDKCIGAVSFTGGSVTGSRISSVAAPQLKKLQLELGGKNAAMVFNDCYLDETVEGIAFSSFLNTGQVCCSGSRVLIQKDIAPKFIEKLKNFVSTAYTANMGDPLNKATMLGPLVSKTHFKKVESYLKLAQKEGGRIILGGKCGKQLLKGTKFNDGNFFEPTIVVDLDDKCRCAMEEIFGPIITVHTFDTEEEALKIANQVSYGLAASIWTSDIRRGQRVARQLEAGSVWINCYLYMDGRMPFGGFKNSGVQREGGKHSIDFFTEIKSIVSKL